MLSALEKHINQELAFLKSKKVLLAVSGGVDSMVLTSLFHQLGFRIGIAHCNFQLRIPECHEDEALVASTARALDAPFHNIQFDTKTYCLKHKVSTQIGARILRYDWFDELCKQHGYDYVLTAHHLNDSLETFLINFSRGTGLQGLTGIPQVRDQYVRPLLQFSKKEIERYALENKITWREDASNQENKYLRNHFRNEVIPNIQKQNPELENNFKNTLNHLQQAQQSLNKYISLLREQHFETTNGITSINIDAFNSLNSYEIHELFKSYNFNDPFEIEKLSKAQTGKFMDSVSHRLLKNRNTLLISKLQADAKSYIIKDLNDTQHLPISISFSFDKKEDQTALDAQKIHFPLILRLSRSGDVFYPLGMQGKKKVSKYLKDEKLSQFDKNNTWILTDANNQIISILGKRFDRRFISQNYENVLYIHLA